MSYSTTAPKSIAQQIADALNNDGQQFETRPTDDSEPQTFRELIEQHGGASIDWRDGWQTGDVRRYTFSDDSVITVAGEGWDLGFTGCFCWEGCPDDDCGEDHSTSQPAERLHGHEAVEYAEAHDLTLSKYADPITGAADGLSPDAARDVCREDASLIWVDSVGH